MAAKEYSIKVPVDFVKRTNGLAIDIGGSLVKFVYRSKENIDEAESNIIGVEGHLQLVAFPRSKLTEAFEYIKQRAKITRNGMDEPPEITSTGIGCVQLGKTVCETLNIRLNNISEFDCFIKAFTHLASRLSRNDFLEAQDLEVTRDAEAEMAEELDVFAKLHERDSTEEGSHFNSNGCHQLNGDERCSVNGPLTKCENIYPCIIAMCGSGIGYMLINADKSFEILDLSSRGGRALHGIGTLLTDSKSFEEFLGLASRGDPRRVDIYSDVVLKTNCKENGDEESIYSRVNEMKHSTAFFSFGRAVGAKKDDFRPEDLAIAWLNYYVLDLTQTLTLIAQLHGIRRLFFCGGLCSSPLVRKVLTKEMTKRVIFLNTFESKKVERIRFDFLKSGSHLGALGALITELETLNGDSNSYIQHG